MILRPIQTRQARHGVARHGVVSLHSTMRWDRRASRSQSARRFSLACRCSTRFTAAPTLMSPIPPAASPSSRAQHQGATVVTAPVARGVSSGEAFDDLSGRSRAATACLEFAPGRFHRRDQLLTPMLRQAGTGELPRAIPVLLRPARRRNPKFAHTLSWPESTIWPASRKPCISSLPVQFLPGFLRSAPPKVPRRMARLLLKKARHQLPAFNQNA